MKRNLVLLCWLSFLPLNAQIQKAVTESGKEVVLLDDRTWRFVHESDSTALETIVQNKAEFTRDAKATSSVQSANLNVAVYHDPKKWKTAASGLQNIEYLFIGPDHIFATLTADRSRIPNLRIVKDVVISNVRQATDYFRLKESEYRTVNGRRMLYLRYIANLKGLDFEYAGYYFINDSGFAMVVAYTMQQDFEAKFPEIQKFLNGFTEISYQPPPPPMRVPKL
ncbi:hypothetical protein P0M11_08065 [Kaistella sp. PBT33-4]|uniref:hypothetical protein n=1 Tax=Kaistella sp. PBT33-4 TaxID=3032000 RepID=UPI0023D7DB0D|nr:hypothetical protein [Kaistella sp. PBT33-4]MDF0719953.1 hypothetical protein [Kaistella sp. PBT33-4]